VDIRPLSLHQPKQLHQNQKKACEQASKNGLGFLDGDHSLQLDASLVDRFPAPLRVYIGCGEVLYGDIDDADLVKIHLQSGKLTLLKYQDYDTSPLPKLKQRIKIRLRDQDIEFFDYGGEYPSQYLIKTTTNGRRILTTR
jgi:DNA phosphorothioation-associated putative methyltransferase